MGYLEKKELSVDMPDISTWQLLAEYLSELGWAKQGMEGYSPIEYSEIESWARVTRLEIQPWTAIMLRKLSQQYANQANISRAPDCPPPYKTEISDEDRTKIREQADSTIRGLF